jgi:hypothetical protein
LGLTPFFFFFFFFFLLLFFFFLYGASAHIGPRPLYEVRNLIDNWSLDEWSARRKAATYTGQHKHNKRRQTSMPLAGFQPTTPVFKRAKTFHTLDRAATVTGALQTYLNIFDLQSVIVGKSFIRFLKEDMNFEWIGDITNMHITIQSPAEMPDGFERLVTRSTATCACVTVMKCVWCIGLIEL